MTTQDEHGDRPLTARRSRRANEFESALAQLSILMLSNDENHGMILASVRSILTSCEATWSYVFLTIQDFSSALL